MIAISFDRGTVRSISASNVSHCVCFFSERTRRSQSCVDSLLARYGSGSPSTPAAGRRRQLMGMSLTHRGDELIPSG